MAHSNNCFFYQFGKSVSKASKRMMLHLANHVMVWRGCQSESTIFCEPILQQPDVAESGACSVTVLYVQHGVLFTGC